MTVWVTSYLAAGTAFAFLTALLAVSSRLRGPTLLLAVATGATAMWAVALAANPSIGGPWLAHLAELCRELAWLAFLARLLWTTDNSAYRSLPGMAAVVAAALVAIEIAGTAGYLPVSMFVAGRLGYAVAGILIIENLFRNADDDARWRLKFMCIGLGAMFGYDFVYYADGLMLGRLNALLADARGAANSLAVPLLAVFAARSREWAIKLHVSRRVVFHTATLVSAGSYLIFMSAAGFYIKHVGGEWGSVLQICFLVGMFVLLGLVLFSGSARSLLRVWVNKHFYSYRYDYREEWLRAIDTFSSARITGTLEVRAIRIIADAIDSPSGALWLRDPSGSFSAAEYWNVPPFPPSDSVEAHGSPFLDRFRGGKWVVELGTDDIAHQCPETSRWLGYFARPWLAVPLHHLERLVGFVVLEEPRTPNKLVWEHYDLLRTLGAHAASYIAEDQATRKLLEAEQFAMFNKRFAFAIHDIKNVVSQLSLLLSNHEKHGSDPEFQRDLIETIHYSVARMKKLLHQLSSELRSADVDPVCLADLIRGIVERFPTVPPFQFDLAADDRVWVAVEVERIRAALTHLIHNAVEAAGPQGRVRIAVTMDSREVVVEVADTGPGMTADFIRTELFRPFASTKEGGFGIGAYQTREIVREAGGDLQVSSEVGRGTTVRLILPSLARSPGLRTVESAT